MLGRGVGQRPDPVFKRQAKANKKMDKYISNAQREPEQSNVNAISNAAPNATS